jgi:hypothetical protein
VLLDVLPHKMETELEAARVLSQYAPHRSMLPVAVCSPERGKMNTSEALKPSTPPAQSPSQLHKGTGKPSLARKSPAKGVAKGVPKLKVTTRDFCQVRPDGTLVFNFHPAQTRMMQSDKRFIVFVAGTRAGKTASGAVWFYEEIRRCGPGDYLVVAPTFPLLHRGALKELNRLLVHHWKVGRVRSNPLRIEIENEGAARMFRGTPWFEEGQTVPTTIYLVHATDPNALEAVTAKAAWCDEAGQEDFKLESWEALNRRLSIDLGRCLITTTPYNLGWLKKQLVDPWERTGGEKAPKAHPHIEVIKAKSIDNPAFPIEEYYRQRDTMLYWRWDMMYNANFTVPAGLIYDCLPEMLDRHRIPRFDIPSEWVRHLGVDFGGINTYALYAALVPNDFIHPSNPNIVIPAGATILYREYYPQAARRIAGHVAAIYEGEPFIDRAAGGAKSEGQWRTEFREHGLTIQEPLISELEVGIARFYSLWARGAIYGFDDLEVFWTQMLSYRYETDPETGNVTDERKIVNQNDYHACDAGRYLAPTLPMPDLAARGVMARGGGANNAFAYYDESSGQHRVAEVIPAAPEGFRVRSGRGLRGAKPMRGLPMPDSMKTRGLSPFGGW